METEGEGRRIHARLEVDVTRFLSQCERRDLERIQAALRGNPYSFARFFANHIIQLLRDPKCDDFLAAIRDPEAEPVLLTVPIRYTSKVPASDSDPLRHAAAMNNILNHTVCRETWIVNPGITVRWPSFE